MQVYTDVINCTVVCYVQPHIDITKLAAYFALVAQSNFDNF